MVKERRRAIRCEEIEPSKTSPGYFKYLITVRELDGTIQKVPAYGRDTQDAIGRLLWNERIEYVAENKFIIPTLIGFFLALVVTTGVLASVYNNPIWIVSGIFIFVVGAISLARIDKYLKK